MPRLLTDWITGYLEYTEESEPPKSYHLWSAISVISSVLQRKCAFIWGSLTFYPNMYVVLVGPSGKTRKGTAMGYALEFLEDIGIHLAAESTTREALIRALEESKDNQPNSAGTGMDFHSSLTIFSPELTVFLGYQNHQLLSDLTDWYDCRSKWTYRTKNMGTDVITGVFVNLFGATTPELIRTALPMDAIGGGLTSRIVYVYEEKKGKLVFYPAVTQKEIDLKVKLTSDLQRIHQIRGEYTPAGDFLEGWIKWYGVQDANPPFQDVNFNGYMERRPNHVLKLSMIVCASEGDSQLITGTHLARAIEILNFTEKKMPMTFMGVGKSAQSATISEVMNEIGLRESITKSELLSMFYRDVDDWMMDKILDTLVGMKWITRELDGRDWVIKHIRQEEIDDEE